MSYTLTIILPTQNEARNIGSFLASLPPDLPLIVVDDSNDETPQLINRLRPYRTRVLRQRSTISQARQIGAAAATTPWFLFTDADVSFAPDYFNLLPAYLNGETAVLYGPKLSQGPFPHYYRWFTRGQKLADFCGIPAASGSNLLIRRDAFRAVGGFDLDLTCNEDSEIAWRIQRQGYNVRFLPQLIVYARDQRRLARQGQLGKLAHSTLRCLLLYTGLLPRAWRRHDWGYWTKDDRIKI